MGRSIQEMYEKLKLFLKDDSLFYGTLIILVAVSSFGLGRLSVSSVEPKTAQNASIIQTKGSTPVPTKTATSTEEKQHSPIMPQATNGKFVGSKNGTKFHALSCPGAAQIKEENKVFFNSKEEAMASGYSPAANCKGIQ